MKKKYSRMISLLICLVLILPTSVFAGQPAADYSGHWAGKQIKSFLDMGFITLDKNNHFKPDEPIARAEFAAIANKAFALIEKDGTSFKDIQDKDEFYKDLLIAKKAGYLVGLPDGTVNPKGYMSRQEYAVILSRLMKLDTASYIAEAAKYADASIIPAWSKGAIGAASKFGYMQGEPGGLFNPKGLVTRGQAVAVLERCYLDSAKAAYSKEGTYSAEVIEGNVVINAPGVTLENTTINGNLILGEGVGNGNVRLKNIIVKGDTIVKGGGPNSIIIEDSQIKNTIVVKEDNKVRVVAVGNTIVEKVDMKSGGKLEEQNTTGTGFGYVTIAEGLNSNEPVILTGSFETVQILAAGVKLNVEAGSIAKLDVANTAEGTKLNLGTGAKVTELIVQAKAEIIGSGTVGKATVAVQGVVITAPTTTITAAAGVTVGNTLPGQSPAPSTPTSGNTGSGGGSGSDGGSRDDDEDRNTTVEVSGVTLNHTAMTLILGEAPGTLTATIAPANATNKSMTWSSSDTKIATVANGIVTPVAVGSATVTVKTVSGSKTAACVVTVKAPEPDSLAVTYTPFEEAGQDIAVKTNYHHNTTASETLYEDTQILSDKAVTFILKSRLSGASSWKNVGTISLTAGKAASLAELLADEAQVDVSFGKLKDMKDTDFAIKFTHISGEPVEKYSGTVNLTFKALAGALYDAYEAAEVIGTGTARAEFEAAPVAVTGVFLNKETLTLKAGGATAVLIATVEPADAANKNVAWSSDNEAVITVADGVVTPVAKGTAVVTVTTAAGGKTASCTVTVIGENEETDIDYLPHFISIFTENISNLSFTVGGELTGPIDTGKLRYITSENGQYGYTLSGSYELVDSTSILEPGQYMHYSFGPYSSVYIYLTDADANGIKGLEGYGNNASIPNNETDRLVAESGWYPNAGIGVKPVEISKEINVVNNTPITINGIYYFDKDNSLIGSRSVSEGYMGNVRISLQTTNVVFYSGEYDPMGKPTSGKMKTVPFDPATTDEIALDTSGWTDVDETNFGPTAPAEEPAFTIHSFAINDEYSEEDLIYINFYPQDATQINFNDFIVQVGETIYEGEAGSGAPSAGKFTAAVFAPEPGVNIGILQIKGTEPFENGVIITITGKNRVAGSASAQLDRP